MQYVIVLTLSILLSMMNIDKPLASDFNETYLRLSITQACSKNSQIAFDFSNVSKMVLFIEPHFSDISLFDAARQGAYITDIITDTRIHLKPKDKDTTHGNWIVLQPSESITHNIDFREYANLDTNKDYKSGISALISIILDDGREETVRLSSSLLNKYYTIRSNCFK